MTRHGLTDREWRRLTPLLPCLEKVASKTAAFEADAMLSKIELLA